MNALTRFDTTALSQLNKALIGFDRMFNTAETRFQNGTNYPPFNIIKYSDNSYEIEIAVSGFSLDDIDVEINQNELIIRGQRRQEEPAEEIEYLHRGLAHREFQKSFTLAEHMEVGEAVIQDGVLSIKITRIIPESLKPRKIQVLGFTK
jgi:molecular chaperone IbpA